MKTMETLISKKIYIFFMIFFVFIIIIFLFIGIDRALFSNNALGEYDIFMIGTVVVLFSILLSRYFSDIIYKLLSELKENQALLKTTLDEQEAILEVQTTGFVHIKEHYFLWTNETFERMLGYNRGELQGKPALMVYETEESYRNYWNKAQYALREYGIFSDELKAVKKDGTPITFIASLTSMKNSPDESMGVIIDISVQKQTEKDLQNALKSNKALLEIINRYVSYVKINLKGEITEISHHLRGELGYDSEHKQAGSIFELMINSRQKLFLMDFLDKAQEMSYTFDVEYRNFNEGTNWYRVSISPEYDPEDHISGYVAFHENLDKMILLKKRSETDQLTGLANRLKIDEVLSHEFTRAERSEKPLSIMIIDIDHFKDVNDRFGHQAGDIVLREFATILKQNVRSTDLVGRWGGEEFLIVCPFTDKDGTLAMAINLQKIIRSTDFSVVGHKTASFGISQFKTGESTDDVFKRVDDALYRAKTSGRDRIEVI